MRLLVCVISTALVVFGTVSAQVVKPRVFLDKAPAIVAYQLKRLSDAELLLVDRETTDAKYAPVFEAILSRATIPAAERGAALVALAELRGQDLPEAILAAAAGIDDPHDELAELLAELLQQVDNLPGYRDLFFEGHQSDEGATCCVSTVGLLALQAPRDEWTPQTSNQEIAYLRAVPLLANAELRDAQRSEVVALVESSMSSELTTAGLQALQSIAIETTGNFAIAAQSLENPETTPAAIALLLSLPAEAIDPARALGATELLVERIAALPVAERTTPEAQQLVAATDKLLPRVAKDQARPLRDKLREITVRVVRVTAVYEEMRYDEPYFVVEAGRKVRLELDNPDAMPHNWVLCQPETIRDVAKLAAGLSGTMDEAGRQYVPDDDRVLTSTPAAQGGAMVTVDFEAPTEPGEYPYVCTFPGHWMRMYGVMLVVDDIDAWNADPQPPADPLGSNRQFVQKWTIDDFQDDLAASIDAASPDIGAQLFVEATCASCHKVDCEGGQVGPDLTDVYSRLKGDNLDILREIVDPSHKIDKKYEAKTVYTMDGRVIAGIIIDEDDEGITLITNPDAPEPTKIAEDDIDEIETSKVSIMPKGLVDRFTRDEILEIVGYLKHVDTQAKEAQ